MLRGDWTFPERAERRRILSGLLALPDEAARFLLGHVLVRRRGRRLLAARIVEVEAYMGQDDPAAHAWRGRTARTNPLWGPPGTVYVYLIYGMHHCLNIAVQPEGVPGCVLVRAAEPMFETARRALTGPGRLCRILDIDTRLSGRHLFGERSALYLREGEPPARIGVSARVGITHAAERPLRFYDATSAAVTPVPRQPGALRRRAGGGRLNRP